MENPVLPNSFTEFFKVIFDNITVLAVPLIVFFLVYAGYLYVTARGNAETIQRAHRALLFCIIGGIIMIGVNVLLNITTNTVDSVIEWNI